MYISHVLWRLYFAPDEIPNHLSAADPRHPPQRREVERAAEPVGESEEEHGWDPAAGIFEGKAALGHLVLFGLAPDEVVHAALRVDLGLVRPRLVGPLFTLQDVEVVVGRVASCVAFCADSGTCISPSVNEKSSLGMGSGEEREEALSCARAGVGADDEP